jgi:hypothetical protein
VLRKGWLGLRNDKSRDDEDGWAVWEREGKGKGNGREKRMMGKSGQRRDLPPRRLYAMIDAAKDGAANE